MTRAFLRAELDLEYKAWVDSGDDLPLLTRLREWANRRQRNEVADEGAFTQTFLVDTWGYRDSGRASREHVTLHPKLRIAGAGAGGGMGEADAAMGFFGDNPRAVPQVLCEFKDVRSGLDAPQNRKGNNRSPVKQCQDYIRGARKGLFGNEPVQPWWGVVTDMNEFRLYWWDRMPQQYLRFVLRSAGDLFDGAWDLLTESDEARFDRFLFQRLFHCDQLLSQGGKPALLRLIERQWVRERRLEGEFYEHYKSLRERLFNVLLVSNRGFADRRTELLRLTQKLLDRFIFAFYCEDMGGRMAFPPQLIRDRLKSRSIEIDYEPEGDQLWAYFRRLFRLMDTGGPLGFLRVPHINGGLFAPDPEIEALELPNHVFAAAGQGANDATLERDKDTLLYLCARYNYASRGDARESLSLYTLGRIFEQSITELEYRQGELEERDTVVALSERKRNGVYYTPEWAVNLLVKFTLDPWFAAARGDAGLPPEESANPPTLDALLSYEDRLRRIRIVDPACGSGAFLISAFRRLLDERVALARQIARIRAGEALPEVVEEPPLIGEILENNIYGVDLNPASVEIAKLALWLHSARADSPLSSLDHTIRCGNSLVGPDFWQGRTDDPDLRDSVRAFDWMAAFPEVHSGRANGGFDIVLGNPPYVKRQHLEAAAPEVAAYLMASRGEDTYQSAQTANFDLYLPFIEKGLRQLGPGGRMGFIAPNMWPINQYGEGLRRIVREGRHLERWVDFKSYQVFQDVTVYTALQVFSREPTEGVRVAPAPEGEGQAAAADWSDSGLLLPWSGLSERGEWLMATGRERAFIERMAATCNHLGSANVTSAVFQGLITSADDLYHLRRIGHGRYWCEPNPRTRRGAAPHEVEIEDELMRPLVSGPEAKRYEEPETDTWLLFPYMRDDRGEVQLCTEAALSDRYPRAWAHLQRWEADLRARERGAFDDAAWWRFGRNQNLDKQDGPKLIVAQTVPSMRVCADTVGDKYLNNVRVNGILPAPGVDQFYLLAVLNGPVADYVFRRISKPKQGGWFEANRQFIAPLPIPPASAETAADVAQRARAIQGSRTRRRDLKAACEDRLGTLARRQRDERWLWPTLPEVSDLEERAPRGLRSRSDRRAWSRAQLDEAIEQRLEALQARLATGDPLEATFDDGELKLLCGGSPVLGNIYIDQAEGRVVCAYWRWLLLSREWSEAEDLVKTLRRPPLDAESAAVSQFVERVEALARESAAIEQAEREMDDHLFDLYGLTPEERLLVEKDRVRRT
ncbi:Eco57I restriction-modification methylase domain-containing protein [Phenylobacterium sp.]|uniref:Eco57I restriction-modification methylase domain-containing protein n=1 Tax=Phenylobacterium sp. TaxID=1871053 RepID=UPI002DF1E5FA|nr:DNA methyltransferase [Phenylobacterium sp.]